MPATSRQAESGSTRSASGLAGSPSKSTIFQPLTVRRVWPRCRSPCTCCTWTLGDVGHGVERGAQRRRRTPPARARRRGRRRAARSSRRPARPAGRACGRAVGKCSARSWCTSASASPSRAASAAKSPPTSSACRSASANRLRTLASASVPAVGGGAQELLQHRQLERRPSLAVGPRASRRACATWSEPASVSTSWIAMSGLTPGCDLAEHLEERVLAEGDRGVGLLAGEQRRVRVQVEVVAGQPVELEVARRLGSVEGAQPARHRLAVVQRVVGVHEPAELGVLPPADERVVEALLAARRSRRAGPGRARSSPSSYVSVTSSIEARAGVPVSTQPRRRAPVTSNVAALAAEPAGARDEALEVVEGQVSVGVTAPSPPRRGGRAGTSRSRSRPGSAGRAARRSAGT